MKKLFLLLFTITLTSISSVSMAALSNNGVRNETRFLSDKMAYELRLTNAQYNDIYEINYDFIASINRVMDYAVRGYEWAMNDYYDALDLRNDELRYVLSNSQYRKFMRMEYFYKPIVVNSSRWNFRIYNIYSNRNQYYLPRPYHYNTYKGGNRRANYSSNSHYNGRHKHDSYYSGNNHRIRNDRSYQNTRRADFGSVNIRPNTASRPNNKRGTDIGSGTSVKHDSNSSNRKEKKPNYNNSGIGNGATMHSGSNNNDRRGRQPSNGGIGSGAGVQSDSNNNNSKNESTSNTRRTTSRRNTSTSDDESSQRSTGSRRR